MQGELCTERKAQIELTTTAHHAPPAWSAPAEPQDPAAASAGGDDTTARQISHAIPPQHKPTQARKPQNTNDHISIPEILSEELHATLMIDNHH